MQVILHPYSCQHGQTTTAIVCPFSSQKMKSNTFLSAVKMQDSFHFICCGSYFEMTVILQLYSSKKYKTIIGKGCPLSSQKNEKEL